jgi:hydrogenase-1 operon protein HyaE
MSMTPMESLLASPGVREISAAELDAFLDGSQAASLVFVRGEAARRPETTDVAVVLRELGRVYGDRVAIGVARASEEPAIRQRIGSMIVPSVAVYRGATLVRTLPRIADWVDYRDAIEAALSEESAA